MQLATQKNVFLLLLNTSKNMIKIRFWGGNALIDLISFQPLRQYTYTRARAHTEFEQSNGKSTINFFFFRQYHKFKFSRLYIYVCLYCIMHLLYFMICSFLSFEFFSSQILIFMTEFPKNLISTKIFGARVNWSFSH